MKRKNRTSASTYRLYGGLLLGWTWPLAATLARLRVGWYVWLGAFGGGVAMLVWAATMFVWPSLIYTSAFDIALFFGVGLPFGYLMLVFLVAPLVARWRWAEQQLIINWAARQDGSVRIRTDYRDFASTEWEQSGAVFSDAPILAHGDAIGFPTVASCGRVTVGRAVLGFRSAVARAGRSRGSRDVILFAFVPLDMSSDLAPEKVCCWRRSAATRTQARMLERLRQQSFESIELDRRVWVGIGPNDDPLIARQIIDPATVERFAVSDTVWEVTRRGVTAYRRGRTTRVDQIDQLVADAEFLARRVQSVAGVSRAA